VGGAGVITGGVAGVVAVLKGQSLLVKCPDHVCATQAELALAGPYNAARAASTTGFLVGVAGLVAGIPILAISPRVEYVYPDGGSAPKPPAEGSPDGRPAPPPHAGTVSFAPWVTWGGAGVRGVF